jgi:hypothetical protein
MHGSYITFYVRKEEKFRHVNTKKIGDNSSYNQLLEQIRKSRNISMHIRRFGIAGHLGKNELLNFAWSSNFMKKNEIESLPHTLHKSQFQEHYKLKLQIQKAKLLE